MNNEVIQGIFYEKELQLSKNSTGRYIIEKILKTNKNKMYVNGGLIRIILTVGLIKIV